MKLAILAATEMEVARLRKSVDERIKGDRTGLDIRFHITGVGLLSATYSISKITAERTYDLIIQPGIAGTFDKNRELGEVVVVKTERTGDIGVEEGGVFKDIFEMGLEDTKKFPFSGGSLINPHLEQYNLLKIPTVDAVTISEITTRPKRIEQLTKKYTAAVESMEGAALHYCCLHSETPFIQIRAISNYVGERDKSKWMIKEALENLGAVVIKYLFELENYIQRISDEVYTRL